MCLAIPAKIIACDWEQRSALVDLAGVQKTVSLMLLEQASIGDYVLVHVGFALNTISAEEAQRTLELFEQANILGAASEIPR